MWRERFSKAIMIGDSDNDAIGAQEIGTQFIGVTYGFGFSKKKIFVSIKMLEVQIAHRS